MFLKIFPFSDVPFRLLSISFLLMLGSINFKALNVRLCVRVVVGCQWLWEILEFWFENFFQICFFKCFHNQGGVFPLTVYPVVGLLIALLLRSLVSTCHSVGFRFGVSKCLTNESYRFYDFLHSKSYLSLKSNPHIHILSSNRPKTPEDEVKNVITR